MAPGFMVTTVARWTGFIIASAHHVSCGMSNGEKYNRKLLSHPPVKLKSRQRKLIEKAIRETCKTRKWKFWVTNVRTNHVHTVVSALCKPEYIRSALKASATRKLREGGCWRSSKSPWVEKGSIKWLWTERDLINAIVYVEYDQGRQGC
jgi:REP element-mobilizing transposase RayT